LILEFLIAIKIVFHNWCISQNSTTFGRQASFVPCYQWQVSKIRGIQAHGPGLGPNPLDFKELPLVTGTCEIQKFVCQKWVYIILIHILILAYLTNCGTLFSQLSKIPKSIGLPNSGP